MHEPLVVLAPFPRKKPWSAENMIAGSSSFPMSVSAWNSLPAFSSAETMPA